MDRFTVLRLARRFGLDIRRYGPYQDPFYRLLQSLRRENVTVMLDVGGNVGQYGERLRIAGYQGRIISYEPLSEAHAALVRKAAHDAQWIVAPRCALAAHGGITKINIANNSQSSSILAMLHRHQQGDPQSGYIGSESVSLMTLDDALDAVPDLTAASLGLKIDTQGYEAEVLKGLQNWSDKIKVMQLEMSLVPLYESASTFDDLFQSVVKRGYRCISIEPGFIDPNTAEVLQVDAIFQR